MFVSKAGLPGDAFSIHDPSGRVMRRASAISGDAVAQVRAQRISPFFEKRRQAHVDKCVWMCPGGMAAIEWPVSDYSRRNGWDGSVTVGDGHFSMAIRGGGMDDSMGDSNKDLLRRAVGGDADAFDQLFSKHRDRLRRAIQFSLHPLVRTRLDESDIVQNSYIKALNNIASYEVRDGQPFFLWLRFIAKQQVLDAHRTHLDADMRSRHLETDTSLPDIIAARLRPQNSRSPLSELAKEEISQKVRHILAEQMSESDREILLLRHFEMLTNEEIAHELSITRTNASSRYIRALTRLRTRLESELGSTIE